MSADCSREAPGEPRSSRPCSKGAGASTGSGTVHAPTGRMVVRRGAGPVGSGQGVVGGTGVPLSADVVVPGVEVLDEVVDAGAELVDAGAELVDDVVGAGAELVVDDAVGGVVVGAVVAGGVVVVVGRGEVVRGGEVGGGVVVVCVPGAGEVAAGDGVRGCRAGTGGAEGSLGMLPGPIVCIRARTVAT